MAELQGRKPKDTYQSILKIEGGVTSSLVSVESGDGKSTPLKLSLTSIAIHDLVFPSTAIPGRFLAVSQDGTSMEWKSAPSGGGGGNVGSNGDPDEINYFYNENDAVSVMTERFGSDVRTTTYDYNPQGKVETVTINYLGQTRVETYTYVNGKVTSMVATTN